MHLLDDKYSDNTKFIISTDLIQEESAIFSLCISFARTN